MAIGAAATLTGVAVAVPALLGVTSACTQMGADDGAAPARTDGAGGILDDEFVDVFNWSSEEMITFFGFPPPTPALLLFSEELLSVEAPRRREVRRCAAAAAAAGAIWPTPTQQPATRLLLLLLAISRLSAEAPRGGRADDGGKAERRRE